MTEERITYESVTIHFQEEGRDPMTVSRVIDLVESCFPGSGERALQVIDDPAKRPAEGLFEATLILVRPDEIDRLVLQDGAETKTASAEEIIGG